VRELSPGGPGGGGPPPGQWKSNRSSAGKGALTVPEGHTPPIPPWRWAPPPMGSAPATPCPLPGPEELILHPQLGGKGTQGGGAGLRRDQRQAPMTPRPPPRKPRTPAKSNLGDEPLRNGRHSPDGPPPPPGGIASAGRIPPGRWEPAGVGPPPPALPSARRPGGSLAPGRCGRPVRCVGGIGLRPHWP